MNGLLGTVQLQMDISSNYSWQSKSYKTAIALCFFSQVTCKLNTSIAYAA